jgi:glyoxylase-like metal-dependent hydrolase (beta-lactamase superfamily II)
VTYLIGDAAFVGDTLFMPDFGTARTDFPGGDAPTLYRSIKRILSLPDETRIFTGHDYAPGGRDYAWESNVQEQNQSNVHIKADVSEDDFVQMRTDRDATLEIPSLILPSVQVNIRAGHMPQPEDNGVVYLKVPINHF